MAQTMTKEQASKNLALPANADIETIRIRFAARYSRSDEAHDRALTSGMQTIHEAHLRSLESAYKILTDNPVINDMGALLSLSKGYITEGGDALGDDQISPEEALAFFALFPHDTPLKAEERYTQYIGELQEAIEQTALESSKAPFRKEIERAEACLHVAVNYLMAGELNLSGSASEVQEHAEEQEETPETTREADLQVPVPLKTTSISKWWLPFTAILLLGTGIAFGLWWKGSGANPKTPTPATDEKRDKQADLTSNSGSKQPQASISPIRESEKVENLDMLPPDELKKAPEAEDTGLNVLANLLIATSNYQLSAQSTGNTWYLAANDSSKRNFIVPVSSIRELNTAGTLHAKPGRSFKSWYAGSTPKDAALVPGFMKRTATPAQRDKIRAELARYGVKADSGNPTTPPPSKKLSDTVKKSQTQSDTLKKVALEPPRAPSDTASTEPELKK